MVVPWLFSEVDRFVLELTSNAWSQIKEGTLEGGGKGCPALSCFGGYFKIQYAKAREVGTFLH